MAQSKQEFAADDPFELVGCTYDVEAGTDPDLEMARCFVEEYALMGFPAQRIRALFEAEFFAGTHDILSRRGPEFVDRILADVFGAPVQGV